MGPTGRLKTALSVTLAILALEVAGGLASNSLALLSDAGHVFTDALALTLSLVAARVSTRPLDPRATYGYHRVGLLAAVVNGLSLVGIASFIFYESYRRFVSPPGVELSVMLPVAVAGFVANLLMAAVLGRGHGDLNVKSAWLHVVGDTLSSFGVIVSGAVIYFTGWVYADPLAGLVIGMVIVIGGMRVVKEALHVFLDLVPKGYDVGEVAGWIEAMPEVLGVHDVHMRSLTHGRVSFAAHVWVADRMLSEVEETRRDIERMLKEKGISHVMLQFECVQCDRDGLYCRTCAEAQAEHRHGH